MITLADELFSLPIQKLGGLMLEKTQTVMSWLFQTITRMIAVYCIVILVGTVYTASLKTYHYLPIWTPILVLLIPTMFVAIHFIGFIADHGVAESWSELNEKPTNLRQFRVPTYPMLLLFVAILAASYVA